MKSILSILLLLITLNSFAQDTRNRSQLVSDFNEYSESIISKNHEKHVDLIYPNLFNKVNTKEKALELIRNRQIVRDDSYIQSKTHIDLIKIISKPYVINNTEFIIIDYINLYTVVFTKEFIEKSINNDSFSKMYKVRVRTNESYRFGVEQHEISFDYQKKLFIETFHNRVIAVKDKGARKWKFIPRFQQLFNLEYGTRYSDYLKNILPKRIVKRLFNKMGYNCP